METAVLFPLLFLLSYALMMIFMMRGHGHWGHGTQAHQHADRGRRRGGESERPEAERWGR